MTNNLKIVAITQIYLQLVLCFHIAIKPTLASSSYNLYQPTLLNLIAYAIIFLLDKLK